MRLFLFASPTFFARLFYLFSIHISVVADMLCYTIGILIYASDEFFRLPLEYRDTNLFIVPLTRLVSFLFPFLFFFSFFPFSLFLQKVFSRENPSSRKLNRVISFDQVVTQLRSN